MTDVEFTAEDELMEIMPNMRMDSLNFICDYFGPFFCQISVKVLEWHTVALKKRGKRTIRPPQWIPVENLTQDLEAEREDQGTFQVVPFLYI
ncbi:DNA replication complex GINS protein PSF2-like isoform X2 [Mangifera indica]|uniref:DNA replication complex GINS protein PSF2-like isoform X2 n=2 Tax=Mangifera indica TaxID=29780 RepID=UPI001CFB3619|nr:DNA replication complex GINS protein PSF2-like isoform X2 [Mangifera indica]